MVMPGDKRIVDPKHWSNNRPDAKLTIWKGASVGDARRDYDELGNEMGEWINSLAVWQWFVTCTLSDKYLSKGFTEPGLGSARACLRELVVRSCVRQFICVFELQKSGVPHLHALLAGCPAINGGEAQEFFYRNYGISRWKVFQDGGGAPRYISGYLSKEIVEMYVGTQGPYEMDDFKEFTGGLTKRGTRRYNWDTSMGGTRV